MATIAEMIASRLRSIDAAHAAEIAAPQRLATGGAVRDVFAEAEARAQAREQRLWEAIQADRISVWSPDGARPLGDFTNLLSRLRVDMRRESALNGATPTFRRMARLATADENLIKIAASRASDREAERTR